MKQGWQSQSARKFKQQGEEYLATERKYQEIMKHLQEKRAKAATLLGLPEKHKKKCPRDTNNEDNNTGDDHLESNAESTTDSMSAAKLFIQIVEKDLH